MRSNDIQLKRKKFYFVFVGVTGAISNSVILIADRIIVQDQGVRVSHVHSY